jgi:hypothetical protein
LNSAISARRAPARVDLSTTPSSLTTKLSTRRESVTGTEVEVEGRTGVSTTGSTTEEAFFGLETFFGEEALVSTTEGATVEGVVVEGAGAVVLDDARTILFLL